MKSVYLTFLTTMAMVTSLHASPRLGIATTVSDTVACVTFGGAPVPPGTYVFFVFFSPPRVVDGVVGSPVKGSCNSAGPQEGQAYGARMRYGVGQKDELSVCVDDPTARVQYVDGEFVVMTKDTVNPLRFESCTSHEGVHLSAWRGNRKTWDGYWYLGYDVEPSCPDEEGKD